MKFIAKYFELLFIIFFLFYSFFKIQPKDFDVSKAFIGYGILTTALSIGVIAVFHEENSTKAITFKIISFLLFGVEVFAGIATFTSYTGIAFNNIPVWLKVAIAMPPALIVLLSLSTLDKVRKNKKADVQPITTHPYSELSKNLQSNSKINLPTYEISSVLPIKNSEDKIAMLKYMESFNNVLRCKPDGTIIWQAELPTASNDVYTHIEWRDDYLMAFSRSCMTVKLDEKTGRILPAKSFIEQVAA